MAALDTISEGGHDGRPPGCEYFTTMDYKPADSLSPCPPALLGYLKQKGLALNVRTPSLLFAELA